MKDLLNHMGHVGYALIFGGMLLLAHYSVWGWVLRLAGEFLWLLIGLKLRMSSIWFWGALGMLFEVYGLITWTVFS